MKTKIKILPVLLLISMTGFSQPDSSVYCVAFNFIKESDAIQNSLIEYKYLSKFKYKFLNKPITYGVSPIIYPIPIEYFLHDSVIKTDYPWILGLSKEFDYDQYSMPGYFSLCGDSKPKVVIFFSKYVNGVLVCEVFRYRKAEPYVRYKYVPNTYRLILIFNNQNEIVYYKYYCIDS